MATSWFNYNGTGSVNTATNYSAVSGAPNCPSPKVFLCAIFAETQLIEGTQRPVITASLQTEINAATSGTPHESSNVLLRPTQS